MTPHFTLSEFTASAKAAERGLDNSLPDALLPAAEATLEMMERIRAILSEKAGHDIPINVSSGYRSPAVNMAVGSSSTSDHPKACAVDWTAPSFGTPAAICKALAPFVSVLGIGQLILEFADRPNGGWVHTSTRLPSKALNRVITINSRGTSVGIKVA
jgi:hypothetical protein